MRPIDADALRENMKFVCMGVMAGTEPYAAPLTEIDNAPTIEPEQQWIPCSERLPNTNGIYIVTRRISDGFEYQNITDACYFDGSNTWHDDTRINHGRKYLADVRAWMSLPEPWRGEEHETSGHIQGT